jgi:hypothetical protein
VKTLHSNPEAQNKGVLLIFVSTFGQRYATKDEPHTVEVLKVIITPCRISLLQSSSTVCDIVVLTNEAEKLFEALIERGLTWVAAPFDDQYTRLRFNFSFESALNIVDWLKQTYTDIVFTPVCYWMNLGGNPAGDPDIFIKVLKNSPPDLEVSQNLEVEEGQPPVAHYPLETWKDFLRGLRGSGMFGSIQSMDADTASLELDDDGNYYVELAPKADAAPNLEALVYEIARLFPQVPPRRAPFKPTRR